LLRNHTQWTLIRTHESDIYLPRWRGIAGLLTEPQKGMVHIICLWFAIAKTVKISGEKNIVNFTGLSSQSESPKISIHWFWYADYGYGSDKINNKSATLLN